MLLFNKWKWVAISPLVANYPLWHAIGLGLVQERSRFANSGKIYAAKILRQWGGDRASGVFEWFSRVALGLRDWGILLLFPSKWRSQWRLQLARPLGRGGGSGWRDRRLPQFFSPVFQRHGFSIFHILCPGVSKINSSCIYHQRAIAVTLWLLDFVSDRHPEGAGDRIAARTALPFSPLPFSSLRLGQQAALRLYAMTHTILFPDRYRRLSPPRLAPILN